MKLRISLLLSIIFAATVSFSQDKSLEKDYERAVSYLWQNTNNKKIFNLHIQPHWFPDSTGLWYVHRALDNKKYLKISLPGLEKSDLFDHDKLAAILSDSLAEEIKAGNLPLSNTRYLNASEISITANGKKYILNTEKTSLRLPEKENDENEFEEISPDKKWTAYVEDYNLYIKSTTTDEVKQLSTAGRKGYEYATWYGWGDIMIGENGSRPEHFGVEWSDNSEWLYANIIDLRSAQKMYLLNWSIDSLYRPQLLSYYRGSPGDTAMIYVAPAFFNIKTGREIRPKLPRSSHINRISVRQSKTPGVVYLQRSSRGFQNLSIYRFDLKTEELETLYTESSTTNIDNFRYHLAENSNRIFILSEKGGWRQLYSLNLKTKKLNPVTNGSYYIHSIERIDEEKKEIYFRAAGKEDGANPYHRYIYKISFNGKGLKLLTTEGLNHNVGFSPDGKYFVDNFSSVTTATTTSLRSAADGKILVELGKADISGLEGWQPPQTFTTMAHDGKTTLHGALWKPINFDASKSYPIIENSYTGPHTQVFPREFRQAFFNQALAELGFIVMKVDGLGSSGRSKEFHNYSYKNLGGNLKDHVGTISQLGKRFTWFDTTRVGIYGHSAGGYDAGHAVLAYPDVYKVAVASSADHDHRMEKAWWPEMYMGWPVDSAYHLQSNITMAGNLKGKLLITHGGIDENVNPSATFKLADALIQADKQFDMLILPSQRHGYRGKYQNYFTKIRWNYFVEHLLGKEPIWNFEWQ